MDRTLTFDVSNHLRNSVFRRNCDHHMHVIGQQMPLFDPAFLLNRQLSEHFAKMVAKLTVQSLTPIFRDKDHAIFAVPLRVTLAIKLVHRDLTFRVRGGSRKRWSWTSGNIIPILPPRHSRGSPLRFRIGFLAAFCENVRNR